MGSPKRPQVRSAQRNAARIVAEQAGAGSSAASDLSQTASCPASTHQAPMASEDADPSNDTGSLGQERAEAPAEQTVEAPTQQAATEATAAQETLPDAADREPYTEATSKLYGQLPRVRMEDTLHAFLLVHNQLSANQP